MEEKKENIIQKKSYNFALDIIALYKILSEQNKEFVLSKQLLRSGTSIGANVEEAIWWQSKKDFIMKMNISYKEARETSYWLRLLRDSRITDINFEVYLSECDEILKILSRILQTSKNSL